MSQWGGQQQAQGYGQIQPYGPPPGSGYIQGWTCRCCGYVGVPARQSKVSTAGWIVALVLALTCAGLLVAWVPLLILRDTTTLCPRCRTPHGTG